MSFSFSSPPSSLKLAWRWHSMKLPWSGTTLIQNRIPRTSGFWLLGVCKRYRGKSFSYQRHVHALQLKQCVASTQSGTGVHASHSISSCTMLGPVVSQEWAFRLVGKVSWLLYWLQCQELRQLLQGPHFSVVQLERWVVNSVCISKSHSHSQSYGGKNYSYDTVWVC